MPILDDWILEWNHKNISDTNIIFMGHLIFFLKARLKKFENVCLCMCFIDKLLNFKQLYRYGSLAVTRSRRNRDVPGLAAT